MRRASRSDRASCEAERSSSRALWPRVCWPAPGTSTISREGTSSWAAGSPPPTPATMLSAPRSASLRTWMSSVPCSAKAVAEGVGCGVPGVCVGRIVTISHPTSAIPRTAQERPHPARAHAATAGTSRRRAPGRAGSGRVGPRGVGAGSAGEPAASEPRWARRRGRWGRSRGARRRRASALARCRARGSAAAGCGSTRGRDGSAGPRTVRSARRAEPAVGGIVAGGGADGTAAGRSRRTRRRWVGGRAEVAGGWARGRGHGRFGRAGRSRGRLSPGQTRTGRGGGRCSHRRLCRPAACSAGRREGPAAAPAPARRRSGLRAAWRDPEWSRAAAPPSAGPPGSAQREGRLLRRLRLGVLRAHRAPARYRPILTMKRSTPAGTR